MKVQRPRYLNQLIDKKNNGRVKIITGIRRCGKSYLLFELYRKYLIDSGVNEKQIIMIALDTLQNIKYRNPIELDSYLRKKMNEAGSEYYIFLDEIQFTVSNYLEYFIDAFLIEKARRFDVKGRKYISSPYKYYFSDIGLRNARLNFRQDEINHIMENVIYNELRMRRLNVDVGIVEYHYRDDRGKFVRKNLEVDFVVNRGSNRYYIQSALHVDTPEKRMQETESLRRTGDSFKKIVVVKNPMIPRYDDDGILYVGVEQFLLDESFLKN